LLDPASLTGPVSRRNALQLIWPWQDRQRRFSWLKATTFALMLVPAIRTAWLIGAGDYGSTWSLALPALTYWSGVWATVILLMALAVTPAATILRWPALIDVRRMIGVTALVYSIAHVLIYFAFRRWDFGNIAIDVTTRFTLIVATLSTIGLIALGATSVDAAIRYMGAKNWQRLHTANYAISALAILHVLLARGTYTEQYVLTAIFFWLMAWRVLARYGLGTNAKALAVLAVVSCLVAASLEAGFLWARRGFDVWDTLGVNFNLAVLDFGTPPAWQVLGLGLVVVLAAAASEWVRAKAARLETRQAGSSTMAG
jgi:methionine sulfoxide reductase heme-binding subunit